jgi:hypothetical protein
MCEVRRAMAGFALSDLALAAQAIMIPVWRRVSIRAAEVLTALREDPAAPGLEDRYAASLAELSEMAAVFAESRGDTYAITYQRVCRQIADLMAAAGGARPAWRILQRTKAIARGHPPRERVTH